MVSVLHLGLRATHPHLLTDSLPEQMSKCPDTYISQYAPQGCNAQNILLSTNEFPLLMKGNILFYRKHILWDTNRITVAYLSFSFPLVDHYSMVDNTNWKLPRKETF